MFEVPTEPCKHNEPQFRPPIGIVEIVLAVLVFYCAYALFVKEDQRVSRYHGDVEVAARLDR
jgi:hypothetical protein